VASASGDATIKLWNAAANVELRPLFKSSDVSLVAFNSDGTRMTTAADADQNPGPVKVWDTITGVELTTLKDIFGPQVLALSPDGTRLASAGEHIGWAGKVPIGSGKVQLWEAATGKEICTLDTEPGPLAFSPDGTRLATACVTLDNGLKLTVMLWASKTGEKQHRIQHPLTGVQISFRGACCLAFSPDSQVLATGSASSEIQLWNAATGEILRTLRGHNGQVTSVGFSADGTHVISGGMDNTIRVWAAETGTELCALRGHSSRINSVCFSPDGTRIVSASQDLTVRLWDTKTFTELYRLAGWATGVSFSPDGDFLAGAVKAPAIWDGRPLTQQIRIENESRGLVAFLLRKSPSKAELIHRINSNQTIGDEVRREALRAAEIYWPTYVEAQAQWAVGTLFSRPLLRSEVIDEIPLLRLDEDIRQAALEIARRHPENDSGLNSASWTIVSQPNQDSKSYSRALRQAEAVCRERADVGIYLNTLGVAQYRTGQYESARATLTRSSKLNADAGNLHPGDLAFLAMSHHQLGNTDESSRLLIQLRQLMEQERWKKDAESQRFLREAEDRISGPRLD
jgi:WD40 repeat protein